VGPIRTLDLPGVMFTLVPGVGLFTLMALGLAFTDVLTDAMMVENGRPRGLTGAFQSVQWACVTVASVAVGELGGSLAETRRLRGLALAPPSSSPRAFRSSPCSWRAPSSTIRWRAGTRRRFSRRGGPSGPRCANERHA